MYEELIKSLRLCREIMHEDDSCIEFVDGSCEAFPICAYQLMEKAADAIEEMQRCIDGIEADNESLCKQINELEQRMPKTPHGRLIDADALIAENWFLMKIVNGVNCAWTESKKLKDVPTVIPAEEGE